MGTQLLNTSPVWQQQQKKSWCLLSYPYLMVYLWRLYPVNLDISTSFSLLLITSDLSLFMVTNLLITYPIHLKLCYPLVSLLGSHCLEANFNHKRMGTLWFCLHCCVNQPYWLKENPLLLCIRTYPLSSKRKML